MIFLSVCLFFKFDNYWAKFLDLESVIYLGHKVR